MSEEGWSRGGSSQCRTRGGGGVEGSDGLAKEGWPEHCDGAGVRIKRRIYSE